MDAQRRIRYQDDAPATEPMRAQRRERTKPSREDLSVRRRLERSQESARVRTATLQCLACGCQGRGAAQGSRCPACGSLAVQATRLPTQIERANPGDSMRTPQGQTVRVVKIRPHETENDSVYVDTDMGTSVMKRGTDVELVPYNSQQQELPNSGNPNGNVGRLPGSGRGSGGEGMTGKAPTCPVDGARMVFRNNGWICPVDGTTGPTNAAPEGMSPVDWGRGNLIDRPSGRDVPKTHLWASKYNTVDQPALAVRTAERVLSTMEGNR